MEQEEIVEGLGSAGVLGAIDWAYRSATARVIADYSEPAGHDAGWVGTTRFTLFKDRLNRAFSCGNYHLRPEASVDSGADLLFAELTELDKRTMPSIPPGTVTMSNLNGSSGWAATGIRFLLSSAPSNKMDAIRWKRKSHTKRAVASQQEVNSNQVSIFDELEGEEAPRAIFSDSRHAPTELDLPTLVVAHTLDIDTLQLELGIGLPRLNEDGGSPWHWRKSLLADPPVSGGSRTTVPKAPLSGSPIDEPDASVRLRGKDVDARPRSLGGQ